MAPEGGGTAQSPAQPTGCPLPSRSPLVRSALAPRPREVHSLGSSWGAHRQDRAAAPPQRRSPDLHIRSSVPTWGVATCTLTAGGWRFSVLYSLESSRLAANSDKFFPLNSWVPQRSFLSSPQNRSP
ncbi:serine-rich and transmembrane domain-containing protein 1 isoform X1 [Mus caroli]|uniref:Serine-rich and transmembrane domain-containing protein 1 isoform X1 n=1 Tax=Mus caroli TaxID=10089 RepID=A0A6P7QQE5_MUSCR|nr:serine-rich and transmembrane domain-containing protein 1 isoform X1 [Mus caroli]